MHTPSKTQERILTAAAKEPTSDIRALMTELKSPAIRDKVLQSMIKPAMSLNNRWPVRIRKKARRPTRSLKPVWQPSPTWRNRMQRHATPCNAKPNRR